MANSVFSGYFPGIEESFIGRILHLKDTSHIPNALKLEYDNARASRKNSEQKRTWLIEENIETVEEL